MTWRDPLRLPDGAERASIVYTGQQKNLPFINVLNQVSYNRDGNIITQARTSPLKIWFDFFHSREISSAAARRRHSHSARCRGPSSRTTCDGNRKCRVAPYRCPNKDYGDPNVIIESERHSAEFLSVVGHLCKLRDPIAPRVRVCKAPSSSRISARRVRPVQSLQRPAPSHPQQLHLRATVERHESRCRQSVFSSRQFRAAAP